MQFPEDGSSFLSESELEQVTRNGQRGESVRSQEGSKERLLAMRGNNANNDSCVVS